MARESYRVSAPGSLMLLGEHAVLHGEPALVCSVSKRIVITLTPRDDSRITIQSSLGRHETALDELSARKPFVFTLTAIDNVKERIPGGFDLCIDSDFSATLGLGSSAAVTVATVGVLHAWLGLTRNPRDLFETSYAVIRAVQGTGSGADVAAGVFAGMVVYQMDPRRIEPLDVIYPITVLYSGSKTPTVEVIEHLRRRREQNPEIIDSTFQLMGRSVEEAVSAIRAGDEERVGKQLNISQGFMEKIGVSTDLLSGMVDALRAQPEIRGAKISGAGLGDCVIGLGFSDKRDLPGERLDVEMAKEGIRFD